MLTFFNGVSPGCDFHQALRQKIGLQYTKKEINGDKR